MILSKSDRCPLRGDRSRLLCEIIKRRFKRENFVKPCHHSCWPLNENPTAVLTTRHISLRHRCCPYAWLFRHVECDSVWCLHRRRGAQGQVSTTAAYQHLRTCLISLVGKASFSSAKGQPSTFPCPLKVRRRGSWELGDWHVSLAVALGDRDWLLFLHLRRRTAEFDGSSASPPGHRQGRHRAGPSGLLRLLCICNIKSWPN